MSHRFGIVQRSPSYFCHQCMLVVDVSRDESSGEVACQNCNGAFVEELGPRAQGLRRIFGDELDGEDDASDGDDMDEDEDADVEMGNEDHVNRRYRRLGQPRELEASPADVFLQGVFRSLFESIAEERESATPPVRRGMPARQQRPPPPLFAQLFGGMGNAGDYANGESQFEALLQNLFNAGGAGGPTPTAKSAIDAMPRKRLTPEDLETGEGECVVCQEEFEMGSEYSIPSSFLSQTSQFVKNGSRTLSKE
ncbi:E3 ubiquitin-protein ligase RING1-like [Hondaea fermentalgiana]|uniref:RING-type E3 ubiquitin transferase n=1 Tax=Hondaea fermentalgiana TaxID=2315210 RepID=A0A2R5GGZ0_9STRA|nr:E3 ubiquitin-protein ligase RING1-like [Hondaea fermentalgiana]|eukprot:GBG29865.1 E3 ubiquitin-protein ligase RING1-like [Hondaea fermentalgiana]